MRHGKPRQPVVSMAATLLMVLVVSAWSVLVTRGRRSISAPPSADVDSTRSDSSFVELREGMHSRPHWVDHTAVFVAGASLAVSIVALFVSIKLAEHPYPADPTQVPTLGTPQDPLLIDSRTDSYPVFDFLRANTGRKVRLNVHFFIGKYIEVSEEHGWMLIPGRDCPKSWAGPRDGNPITAKCNIIELKINISDPRHGLLFNSTAIP